MRKDKGFVLAEVALATGIFALCVTVALGYVSHGLDFCGKSAHLSRAVQLAKLEMAKVQNIPFPPTTSDTQSLFTVTKTYSNDDADFYKEVIPTDVSGTVDTVGNARIKKIEVNIYRASDDKKMVTLYTYITRNGLY